MASPQMQKQTARNLVLSPNAQTAYGGQLADSHLTYRASVDPSTVFSNPSKRYSDEGSVGRGSDFASVSLRTAWNTMATVKGMGGVDAWLLGQMLALAFGTDAVTGSAAPYTHTFSIGMSTALAPCTTCYIEDTDDVHRYYNDMAAKSLSIDIPERGPINASLDLVGTGKFTPGTITSLPALATPNYLLGSDIGVSITPQGGTLASLIGRQTGISFKLDRSTAPFESSGDGLVAGSCQYGKLKFSVDMTIMAKSTDDVNGYYESDTPMLVTIATNPANTYQLILQFAVAKILANKLGNKDDLVAWQLSFDQTTMIQSGSTPALTAQIINTAPAYLVAA